MTTKIGTTNINGEPLVSTLDLNTGERSAWYFSFEELRGLGYDVARVAQITVNVESYELRQI